MKYVKILVISTPLLSLLVFLWRKIGRPIEKVGNVRSSLFKMVDYDPHRLVLTISLLVLLIVFSIIFYHTMSHRTLLRDKKTAFQKNIGIETAWNLVPTIIVFSMVFYIAKTVL